MSACKQICLEVKNTAKPLVLHLAKEMFFLCQKKLFRNMFDETLNDMTQIQQTAMTCAKTIPLDVVKGFKAYKSKGNILPQDIQ